MLLTASRAEKLTRRIERLEAQAGIRQASSIFVQAPPLTNEQLARVLEDMMEVWRDNGWTPADITDRDRAIAMALAGHSADPGIIPSPLTNDQLVAFTYVLEHNNAEKEAEQSA